MRREKTKEKEERRKGEKKKDRIRERKEKEERKKGKEREREREKYRQRRRKHTSGILTIDTGTSSASNVSEPGGKKRASSIGFEVKVSAQSAVMQKINGNLSRHP